VGLSISSHPRIKRPYKQRPWNPTLAQIARKDGAPAHDESGLEFSSFHITIV
jgi:hypothetical protein